MEYPLPHNQLHNLIDLISRRARCPLNFHGTPDETPRQWLGYLEDQLELTFSRRQALAGLDYTSRSTSRNSHSRSQSSSSEDTLNSCTSSCTSSASATSGSDEGISIPLCQWPYVAVELMRGEVMSQIMRSVMESLSFADSGLVWDEADQSWSRETSASRRQRLRVEWEKFGDVLCELHAHTVQLLASHKKLALGTAYLQAASESTLLEELGIPRPIPPLTTSLAGSSTSSFSLTDSVSRSLSSWFSLSTTSLSSKSSASPSGSSIITDSLLPPNESPSATMTSSSSSSSSSLAQPATKALSTLSTFLPKPKIVPSWESTSSLALTLGIGAIAFYGGHLHGSAASTSPLPSTIGNVSYSHLFDTDSTVDGSDFDAWNPIRIRNLVSSGRYEDVGVGTHNDS
ncbi:hypothetical protein K435DRAFT_778084 [Dendrothele bispora CBS 962.96]|uniref:Uncharacterized protein n=1 Tax=Dendrothele bispora (strain CBS 962.96) TaxID=1314807 RepID=A0A4S8M5C4_DENBC|nr:hypothetical protein K435DRAFT_778084 [Dendrothele bispora CBS 962.96]